jgi:uncharacterized phage-associated protein
MNTKNELDNAEIKIDKQNENQVQDADNRTYSYKDIANYFIKEHKKTGKLVTNMQLQKLLYFANGIYLYGQGVPLIKEHFKAWKYGPVIPELYNELKYSGNSCIEQTIINQNSNSLQEEVRILLESVDETFGKMDGWSLSEISHIKEGAWDKAPTLNSDLDNEHIREEFERFHIPSLIQSKDA